MLEFSSVVLSIPSPYHCHHKQLDSMRWFSHQRRTGAMSALEKCCNYAFLSPVTLTFDPKFELGQNFCTMHLTAKFHYPIFNHSEVIMLKNKQTNRCRWKHPSHSAMLCRWVSWEFNVPFQHKYGYIRDECRWVKKNKKVQLQLNWSDKYTVMIKWIKNSNICKARTWYWSDWSASVCLLWSSECADSRSFSVASS